MSYSLEPRDHTFYEKTLKRLLEKPGSLLTEFTKKLNDLGLSRFDFLYELSSADENFSSKLLKYCKSKSAYAEVSFDTVH